MLGSPDTGHSSGSVSNLIIVSIEYTNIVKYSISIERHPILSCKSV